jgi:hypothetical protein
MVLHTDQFEVVATPPVSRPDERNVNPPNLQIRQQRR